MQNRKSRKGNGKKRNEKCINQHVKHTNTTSRAILWCLHRILSYSWCFHHISWCFHHILVYFVVETPYFVVDPPYFRPLCGGNIPFALRIKCYSGYKTQEKFHKKGQNTLKNTKAK